MRKIFLSFGLLLALSTATVMFSSCDKGEDKGENKDKPTIQLKNEQDLTQLFFADEKEKNNGIQFTTTGAWTSTIETSTELLRSSNATNWISVSPDHGDQAGDYTITISLTVNATGEDRIALIVISSGGKKLTITVTQQAETENGNVPTDPTDPTDPNSEELGPFIEVSTAQQFKGFIDSQGEGVQIVDFRSASEFAAGHIPGAINIPATIQNTKSNDAAFSHEILARLDKTKPVFLYGKKNDDVLGKVVPGRVSKLGFGHSNTYILLGGFEVWQEAFPDEVKKPTDPEVPVAPCEDLLTMNQIRDVWIEYSQGQNYSVTISAGISPFSENYEISINTGWYNPQITFIFREKPVTGVYNTWTNVDSWSPKTNVAVHISKYINAVYEYPPRAVNSNLSVYVNREDDDKIIISFCDLEYSVYLNYQTYPYSITGKFEVAND